MRRTARGGLPRPFSGPGRSYANFVSDFLPAAGPLAGGLEGLLDGIEHEGKMWALADIGGGIGFGLQSASASGRYPHMVPRLFDAVNWGKNDYRPDEQAKIVEMAAAAGVADPWNKRALHFTQEVITPDTIITGPDGVSIKAALLFAVLGFSPDPLGMLLNIYNQLPPDSCILGQLAIPTGYPGGEAIAQRACAFYQRLFDELRQLGVGDIKITDCRSGNPRVAQRGKASDEFMLGMVLTKSVDAPRLLAPNFRIMQAGTMSATTTRAMNFRVIQYEQGAPGPLIQVLPADQSFATAPTSSEAALDVVDGTLTVMYNKPPYITPDFPYRGDVGSSVSALANRVLPRPDDTQLALTAVYNTSGISGTFYFDLGDLFNSIVKFAKAKGIPLAELKVGLDVNPSEINTINIPTRLVNMGFTRANIIAFPQIQQSLNVGLNNAPGQRLHERSPWFTDSVDIFIGFGGATEAAGWPVALSQVPGARVKAAFFPAGAKKATTFAELWPQRLKDQVNVRGEPKEIFDLSDLADLDDHQKAYVTTVITGYMNMPGIEYGPDGVTAYTMVFQEGGEPIIIVDRFAYTTSRDDAMERCLNAIEEFDFRQRYPDIYRAMKQNGPEPAHPVTTQVIISPEQTPGTKISHDDWPVGFFGLHLTSSMAYDMPGKPAKVPPFIRGNGHRDALAAAVASGWMRGVANDPKVAANKDQAKKAVDRLARDAMVLMMMQNTHNKVMAAFEGARDGSASLKYRSVCGKGAAQSAQPQLSPHFIPAYVDPAASI